MRTPVTPAKTGKLAFSAFAMVCMLQCSTNSLGQGFNKNSPTVRLGNMDTARSVMENLTCAQVLADPRLVPFDANTRVTGFHLSFIAKGGLISGPFKIAGDHLLPPNMDSLKKLSGKSVFLVFEEIHVNKNGTEVIAKPLLLKCKS